MTIKHWPSCDAVLLSAGLHSSQAAKVFIEALRKANKALSHRGSGFTGMTITGRNGRFVR